MPRWVFSVKCPRGDGEHNPTLNMGVLPLLRFNLISVAVSSTVKVNAVKFNIAIKSKYNSMMNYLHKAEISI